MSVIGLILPRAGTRRWHAELIDRLKADGHDVHVVFGGQDEPQVLLDAVLAAEKRLFRRKVPQLPQRHNIEETPCPSRPVQLTIALCKEGRSAGGGKQLRFASAAKGFPLAEWASAIAAGQLPKITLELDGVAVARAAPMIENRVSIGWSLENVLARAITLVVKTARQVLEGAHLAPLRTETAPPAPAFLPAYLTSTLPRTAAEIWRRMRYRYAHWRVGYRFVEGHGVAETGSLAGTPWQILPDDGKRFYADPFAFSFEGRHYIFVEDFDHEKGKAVISVSCLDEAGKAGRPVPVLEEPHHLSYPQVFASGGEIWMLPEASAGREVVLYRAETFPFRWSRHAVLFTDRVIADATLIEADGSFWLLATDATSGGSTSDTLVAYRSDRFGGPWQAHPDNPIAIDLRGARPGGAAIRTGGKLLLPVQDGTLGYGGGLGLAEIVELSKDAVRLGDPRPIQTEGFWPYPQIHTLNRHGALEVIDGIAAVRRQPRRWH